MNAIKFKEANVTFAKDQPEYRQLPAYRDTDGVVICCFKLSLKERLKVLFTGLIWIHKLTFNQALQPILPLVDRPFTGKVDKRIENKLFVYQNNVYSAQAFGCMFYFQVGERALFIKNKLFSTPLLRLEINTLTKYFILRVFSKGLTLRK